MKRAIPLVLLPIVASACGDSPTTVDTEPPATAVLASVSAITAGPDGTYPCPEGGEISRQMTEQQDMNGSVVTITWHTAMTQHACGIRIDADTVLRTDGQLTIDGLTRYQLVEKLPAEILESSSHQTGTLRWYGDGYDRTCDIDVTQTLDPSTNVYRMVGSLCGEQVDFEFELPEIG
jgi:hypothetical protein